MPADEVNYILHTRDLAVGELYDRDNGFKSYKKEKRTKILIHGFGESPAKSFAIPMLRKAYLQICDCNVIEVDWSKWAAEPYYYEAARNTQRIGHTVGEFLLSLGTNLSTTELIGYSLGGHVAGKAGMITGSRVSRIIALDPAYPLFGESPARYRLDATDANIVEVVHTSGGTLGFSRPIGLRDLYANGGQHPQPGCGTLDVFCSHRRAFLYYSEALLSHGRGFKARLCTSHEDYQLGGCKGPFLALANHNADKTRKGNFYFDTNSKSPFGKYRSSSLKLAS
ncbi:lipase member H-A-like [Rhodnius prolixus]